MILMYGEAGQNANQALILYRERFPNRRIPRDSRVIVRALQRIREDMPITGRIIPSTNGPRVDVDNEERILEHFAANPECSTRNAGRYFGMNHKIVHRILKKDLQHPYKFLKAHAILPRDLLPRITFSEWVLNQHITDHRFTSRVIWTDESTFTRNGVWNQRNTHYWARVNPHVLKETGHQYRWAVNVWAAVHGDRIIGPVFIDGNLNGEKFLQLLRGPLTNYVNSLPEEERELTWLQLDGAPAHSAVLVRNYLNTLFGNRWIGRFGPRRWPARSPDLTMLDFFLWGAIKNEVYSKPQTSVEDLRNRITDAFLKLQQNTNFQSVHQSIIRRCNTCIQMQGRHIEHCYLRRVNRQD